MAWIWTEQKLQSGTANVVSVEGEIRVGIMWKGLTRKITFPSQDWDYKMLLWASQDPKFLKTSSHFPLFALLVRLDFPGPDFSTVPHISLFPLPPCLMPLKDWPWLPANQTQDWEFHHGCLPCLPSRERVFLRPGAQPRAASRHVHNAGVIISAHWLAVHLRSFQRSKQGHWEISIQLVFWTLNHKHLHFHIQRPYTQSVQNLREHKLGSFQLTSREMGDFSKCFPMTLTVTLSQMLFYCIFPIASQGRYDYLHLSPEKT